MKKLISLVLISVMIIAISTTAFASNILEDENNVTTITGNEYNSAQNNEANNNTSLPQTGIEDSGVGILLIICAASAVFAYRKINDYKNI